MRIEYSSTDRGRCEVSISEDPDWRLFNGIADAILGRFRGRLVERADGLDERYWDIKIGKSIVTLHLQIYIGIILFPKNEEGNDLTREIGRYLEGIEPKKLSRRRFYIKNLFRIRWRRVRT